MHNSRTEYEHVIIVTHPRFIALKMSSGSTTH